MSRISTLINRLLLETPPVVNWRVMLDATLTGIRPVRIIQRLANRGRVRTKGADAVGELFSTHFSLSLLF